MPFVNPLSHIFTNIYDNVSIQLDAVLTVTCDDIITLHATLIGDLTNHTFLWEQVSGTPVIWLEDQDQQTVMFQQPAVRDNKVFRFTLDKGTYIAKFRDILVTAIPTELVKTTVISSGLSGKYSKSLEITNMSVLMPAFKPAGSEVLNDTDRAVLLTTGSLYGMPLTVNEYVAGVDVPIANYTFNNPLSSLVYINGLTVDKNYNLKIDNGYELGVSDYKNIASQTFNYRPDYAVTDIDSLATGIQINNGGLSSIVEVITREVIGNTDSQETISLSEGLSLANRGLSSIVEIIDRSVVSNEESQDTVSISNMSLNNKGLTAIVEIKEFQFTSLG